MATPTDALPEPVAEPPVAAESTRLSLKVRTLDQKTYPITICAAASVPQLKEVVAVETGVTLARQRLIYRGRVLKNDQPLAAYALEDGHVLHLVVRASTPVVDAPAAGQGSATAPAPASDAASAGQTSHAAAPYLYTELETLDEIDELNARLDEFQRASQRARTRSRLRRAARGPPAPRDNDEPDPNMGRQGGGLSNRVLMGATISVPEGADGVTMPFLSNMLANLVTQVSEGNVEGDGAATGTTADGRRNVTREGLSGSTAAAMEAATARALRRHHRTRDGSGSSRQRHARRSSSSAEHQAVLRSRTGSRLEELRAALDDESLDFPAALTPLRQGGDNAVMTELQQQVEMLLTLLDRFGSRLRLLPAALAQRDRQAERSTPLPSSTAPADTAPADIAPADSASVDLTPVDSASGSSSTPNPSTDPAEPAVPARNVIRAIVALQSVGESTDLLARMARHAFVSQSMQLGEAVSTRRDATAANLGSATGARATQLSSRASEGAGARAYYTAMHGAANRNDPDHATRVGDMFAAGFQAAARGFRSRIRVTRIGGDELPGERNAAAARTISAAPFQLPGLEVDPSVSSSGLAPAASQAATPADAAAPADFDDPFPPVGAGIPISAIGGLPLMSSVVFPFSLAAGIGGSHATTTWNLADFVSRVSSELPISTLYGVMAGDVTQVHQIMAHIGFGLFSGVDVPRVSRSSLRAWAQDLISELRRLLRSHALPVDVLDEVNGDDDRRSALGSELLRAMEPFIPDLIDYLVRATSASRAAAFGTSSSAFMRTMAQQVVRQLRSYARGESTESEDESDERLKRLLRGFVVWLGMNEHMAGFVVDSLLCWTEGDSSSSRRGRTRQRAEEAATVDSPAIKRRRD